jgi:MYXO-CTERM domain-containing protein
MFTSEAQMAGDAARGPAVTGDPAPNRGTLMEADDHRGPNFGWLGLLGLVGLAGLYRQNRDDGSLNRTTAHAR